MTRLTAFVVALAVAAATPTSAQSAADSSAIKQAALDYIEGWYEGNAERMERALHPEFAKRIVNTDPRNRRNSLGQYVSMPRPGWTTCTSPSGTVAG